MERSVVNFALHEQVDVETKIVEMLNREHLCAEVYATLMDGDWVIAIEIDHGDWKHEHLRAKWLMIDEFKAVHAGTKVTYEDGSDCYSAIHYFYVEE